MLDEKKDFQDEIKEEEFADTPTADEAPIDEEQSMPVDDLMNEAPEEEVPMDEMPDAQLDDAGEVAPEMGPIEDPYQEPAEKMLTQSQVNELVGRARQEGRDSALKELYGRYGVSGDSELNDVFGRGQAYDGLNDEFLAQGNDYKNVMAENALLKAHVDENRWDDIKLILGGKGLDISQENIEAMLPSHPEWKGQGGAVQQTVQPPIAPPVGAPGQMLSPEMAEGFADKMAMSSAAQQRGPVTTLRKLGNDVTVAENAENEEDRVKRLYGF